MIGNAMSHRTAPRLADHRGFTLAEVLVAMMILTIGLVALVGLFHVGLQATQVGQQKSTAVFLAEQKLEQIKAWAISTAAGRGYATITNGAPSTAACCAADAYNSIPSYGTYRRQVNINDGPVPNTKQIQVQVFYQPTTTRGVGAETFVEVTTYVGSP
jgi:type IV pilus modification protein PilV